MLYNKWTQEKRPFGHLFFTYEYIRLHHNNVLNTKVLAHPHPVKETNYLHVCKLPVSVQVFVLLYFLHQHSSLIHLTRVQSSGGTWVESFAHRPFPEILKWNCVCFLLHTKWGHMIKCRIIYAESIHKICLIEFALYENLLHVFNRCLTCCIELTNRASIRVEHTETQPTRSINYKKHWLRGSRPSMHSMPSQYHTAFFGWNPQALFRFCAQLYSNNPAVGWIRYPLWDCRDLRNAESSHHD